MPAATPLEALVERVYGLGTGFPGTELSVTKVWRSVSIQTNNIIENTHHEKSTRDC